MIAVVISDADRDDLFWVVSPSPENEKGANDK